MIRNISLRAQGISVRIEFVCSLYTKDNFDCYEERKIHNQKGVQHLVRQKIKFIKFKLQHKASSFIDKIYKITNYITNK